MCTNPKKSGQGTGCSWNQSSQGPPHQKAREGQVTQGLRKPCLHLLRTAGRPWTHLYMACSVFLCVVALSRGAEVNSTYSYRGKWSRRWVRLSSATVRVWCSVVCSPGVHMLYAWSPMQRCQEARLTASQ